MATVPRGPESSGFWAVIPAGGAGTRLWPLSRAARPKFLLPLTGTRSLLQQTVDRLSQLTSPKYAMIVCGLLHAVPVARQLPDVPDANIVVEPAPKGTGPAIGLAAALIARQDPHAIMGSFAADHDVRDEAAFVRAVRTAIDAAADGNLVTIGITPTRAETGYGYVERADEVVAETGDGTAYRAACFHEKPDAARAAEYVASGRYLWNASMFVWRVDALLAEMARLQPELHAAVLEVAAAWGTPEQDRVTTDVWASLPVSTIDEGVLEPAAAAGRVAVVPADLGWSDVGDWHGLGELIERDALGNSVRGDLIQIETRESIVWSETGRPVALLGLDNVVVVDTADVLLVSARGRAQEVRHLVDRLKTLKRHELR
ncbi:MAG: mannose-1-phosphate guanylyltransferase [Chloroflexia bacterium]|nr:mannose-1-phosphate guanylyltransferase [Chloroflexia bacterium]